MTPPGVMKWGESFQPVTPGLTSGKWGGGGFEISDIPGRGEGGWFVKVRTSENYILNILQLFFKIVLN